MANVVIEIGRTLNGSSQGEFILDYLKSPISQQALFILSKPRLGWTQDKNEEKEEVRPDILG